MGIRLLVCTTTIMLAGTAWAQGVCNPVCAINPKSAAWLVREVCSDLSVREASSLTSS
jgi:hypothetical protein